MYSVSAFHSVHIGFSLCTGDGDVSPGTARLQRINLDDVNNEEDEEVSQLPPCP